MICRRLGLSLGGKGGKGWREGGRFIKRDRESFEFLWKDLVGRRGGSGKVGIFGVFCFSLCRILVYGF